ncbi:MAG TPA: fused response regulator/phosphatase, partial [Acidiferrobacteraceae bacterium]|nr:fused response regulator/phosphatase [Acidiferrobacteraceae bacterium]
MKKILIVDDVGTNRKLLRQLLAAIKVYEIIEAVDGREAITLFEEEKPDLILMDVNMPEMNGYQSASAIKAITGDNHVPIIFVTALSAKDSLEKSLACGGDDFIGKPFNAEVLASKINAHLRIRELNQQLNDKNKQLNRLNQHLTHEQELIRYFFENALQQSFLDEKFIKYHMSSMSTFDGDLLLVERGLHGGIYLVMGDFTGHGLSAAMGTLPVAMIFFKMVAEGATIGDIARELNHQLNKLMPPSMFFAATLLELNARGDILSVWMGGMPESYWLGKEGALKGMIHAQHMPLGILQDSEFDAQTEIFNVEKGDKVYLY